MRVPAERKEGGSHAERGNQIKSGFDYPGNIFATICGAYFATMSVEMPFSAQMAAYRSTEGRRMRAWVAVSRPHSPKRCDQPRYHSKLSTSVQWK
jgi:hypothetical protein